MDDNFTSQAIINNEFNYSSVIPTIEAISYLINYLYNKYVEFNNLVIRDEEKNKPFKLEYKDFQYKKSYGQLFEVYIVEKTYHNITCKDYDTFLSAVKDGNLKNINSLTVKMCLDFFRGKDNNLVEHENSYVINFKPFGTIFARKSNFNDDMMNNLENDINNILKQFPALDCIFSNN